MKVAEAYMTIISFCECRKNNSGLSLFYILQFKVYNFVIYMITGIFTHIPYISYRWSDGIYCNVSAFFIIICRGNSVGLVQGNCAGG